ncbi:MAG: type I restriction endonuclease [Clostridiaceae bacterium]
MPVTGMPAESGSGNCFVDYILWGKDGTPIALIEAKRTAKDAKKDTHQAFLYANCIEQITGYRPIIFNTNGYDWFLWDDKTAPQRQVHPKDRLAVYSPEIICRKFLTAVLRGKS